MLRRLLVTLTALVCVAALPAAPASAIPSPPGTFIPWSLSGTVDCATGTLNSYSGSFTVDGTGASTLDIRLTGSIKPCFPLTTAGPAFGFMHYWNSGGYGTGRVQYLTGDVSTPYDMHVLIAHWDMYSVVRAVCVNYGSDWRLACLSISANKSTGVITLAPIPTDDPRVTLPYRGKTGQSGPDCIVCP